MTDYSRKLAAIDIGTNSIHLIVAAIGKKRGEFKILRREKDMVRLGTGSREMKRISSGTMYRGIETLKRFKAIADAWHAPVRAVATSAVREAENRDLFLHRVWEETGMKIEIISGAEEAALIYKGVLCGLPVFEKKVLLIDIGGGSTEFLIGRRRKILFTDSLKLGAVRLTPIFFNTEKLDAASLKRCEQHIAETLRAGIGQIKKHDYEIVIGTAGTISNLGRMIKRMRRGKAAAKKGNGFFSKDELFKIVEKIIKAKNAQQRALIDGLDKGRADIIVAGALILKQIFKQLKIKRMTVSKFALREGIMVDSVEKGRFAFKS